MDKLFKLLVGAIASILVVESRIVSLEERASFTEEEVISLQMHVHELEEERQLLRSRLEDLEFTCEVLNDRLEAVEGSVWIDRETIGDSCPACGSPLEICRGH